MTFDELTSLIEDDGLPPPDAEVMVRFESMIGLALPEDYKGFLALTAGGLAYDHASYSMPRDPVPAGSLVRVAGLRSEPDVSLEERWRTANDLDVPFGLLSITTDGAGNDIAISLRPDRLGEVFLLDHEVSGGEGSPTLEDAEADDWVYAIKLAETFTDFVDGLRLSR